MVIALEGLPAAGKTTSARLLARQLGAAAVCETTRDHPFLETIYDDAHRHDMQVELAFLLLHNARYRQIQRETSVVTDFSPVKDQLFAEAMLSGRDFELFADLYEHLYAGYPRPDVVLYLDASPDLCMRRIRGRVKRDPGRRFEEGVDVARLRRLQALYEARIDGLGDTVTRLRIEEGQTEAEVVTALADLLARQDAGSQ